MEHGALSRSPHALHMHPYAFALEFLGVAWDFLRENNLRADLDNSYSFNLLKLLENTRREI